MNENLDLTKILDGCPYGTEFYHLIYGQVALKEIIDDEYPIVLEPVSNTIRTRLTKDGKLNVKYDGECLLYPSKYQRDWSKFVRFWDDAHKIEKFDINTLQPFDKVLVRDDRKDIWGACFFSHPSNNLSDGWEGWFVCDNTYWHYIIPYNDDTKHLVGTREDCPEYYKWWEE